MLVLVAAPSGRTEELFEFPDRPVGRRLETFHAYVDALNERMSRSRREMTEAALREKVPSKYLTLAGKRRIVYGFCHELGHMVAMWGEYRGVEDDQHAWAHYTGCLVVEEVYERLGDEPWPGWTAFQRRASGKTRLEKQVRDVTPGNGSYEEILALFYAISETHGTEVYGEAWKWLERKRRFRRRNGVCYLWLRDLRDALAATLPGEKAREVAGWFAE